MKKFMWTLSTLAMFGLLSCGGGSEEAKELLNRLLRVVGIPYSIVVNICQDDNDNGVCEAKELQTKVMINKGDDINAILAKVSLTTEGEYFLENYDSTKRIIMEIQDSTNVALNQGKFSFDYNPETQELSILQMMIDKGYLTLDDVNAVREMPNVNNFYEVLFRDFETNLNTLGEQDLSSPRAVLANMSEMADELLANGVRDTLPQAITNCNGDQTCVDEILAPISEELLIDENEAQLIKEHETKILKELLLGKTLYLSEYTSKKDYFNKLEFNHDGTLVTDTYLLEENSQRTYSIELIGNRFTSLDTEDYTLFLRVTKDYILFDAYKSDGKPDGQSRLYFDRDNAESYYTTSVNTIMETGEATPVADEDRLKPLLLGKTYHTTACDSENPHVEKLDFATNNKLTMTWVEDDETKKRYFEYRTENNILSLYYEGNNTVVTSFDNVQEQEDKLVFQGGEIFFKNENDADNNLNESGCLGYYVDIVHEKMWQFLDAGLEMTYDESDQGDGLVVITSPMTTSGPGSNDIDAVKYCDGLEIRGYDDWYIPSLNELRDINKTIFREDTFFWSSTEVDENRVYTMNIATGTEEKSDKLEKHLIRCIRDGIE